MRPDQTDRRFETPVSPTGLLARSQRALFILTLASSASLAGCKGSETQNLSPSMGSSTGGGVDGMMSRPSDTSSSDNSTSTTAVTTTDPGESTNGLATTEVVNDTDESSTTGAAEATSSTGGVSVSSSESSGTTGGFTTTSTDTSGVGVSSSEGSGTTGGFTTTSTDTSGVGVSSSESGGVTTGNSTSGSSESGQPTCDDIDCSAADSCAEANNVPTCISRPEITSGDGETFITNDGFFSLTGTCDESATQLWYSLDIPGEPLLVISTPCNGGNWIIDQEEVPSPGVVVEVCVWSVYGNGVGAAESEKSCINVKWAEL